MDLRIFNPPQLDLFCFAKRISRVARACKAKGRFRKMKTAGLRQKCHMSQRSMKKARLP
jgi:hypothetical protein